MATRNGKIAHIPFEIREQLNIRICNGEPGNKLVEWLNSLPAVLEIMNTSFGGRPVSEQNLSEWRNGGYEQWVTLNACLGETTALSESARLIRENGINSDDLLLVITSNYAAMIQRWNITPAEDLDRMMGIFQNLTKAVLSLRQAELQKVRLQFERERLELLREKQRNKSAASSSTRASSSAESAAKSEPAHSTDGAQSGNAILPMPPILPIHTPPPAPAQSPATSAIAPELHAGSAIAHFPPNTGSSKTETSVSEPPAPTPAAAAPRTSSPRNLRGLL